MLSTLPKRGLKIAHVNICSIRNKLQDLSEVLSSACLNILALSETHVDETFQDGELFIQEYDIYRKDGNAHGGGVAMYVQSQIPVKIRYDLMKSKLEVLWLQVQISHLKPILIGCCYRPPNAKTEYLDSICDMLDHVCDTRFEVYFKGDLNIDWNSVNCSKKLKLEACTATCGLTQLINKPTRIMKRKNDTVKSSCIDHIFTNAAMFRNTVSASGFF